MCNIPKQCALAKLIMRTHLLVWDEACMANKFVAECVDRSLRNICSCDPPFGAKVMVFGGDFIRSDSPSSKTWIESWS